MKPTDLKNLLEQVASGRMDVDAALRRLKHLPFEDMEFAKLDHHRHLRQGFPEVIFGQGKTPEQIVSIAKKLAQRSDAVLITRIGSEVASRLRRAKLDFQYEAAGRCGVLSKRRPPEGVGRVAVVTAGTADIPVAEEAAMTARWMGSRVDKIFDVGVAGLHRLLAHRATLAEARCVVVAAGMEGALASVVGGLVSCPVVAVPTSIGYGAAFGGVAALLTMLNACAPNVTVVNIDNGFGAGFIAGLVNKSGGAQ